MSNKNKPRDQNSTNENDDGQNELIEENVKDNLKLILNMMVDDVWQSYDNKVV